MSIEVELKFRDPALSELRAHLAALSATPLPTLSQCDTYFAHPVRDFASTDEAFRIRQVGEENYITYKGPRIDATTKTRQELEIGFAAGAEAAAKLCTVWKILGFEPVATVRKQREPFELDLGEATAECVIDSVEGLGTFAELEIVTDEEGIEPAKATLFDVAARLGLTAETVEMRSYLHLLLIQQRSPVAPGS